MEKYTSGNREKHPFELFAKNEPKTLIIGSFPTTKDKWSFEFYYPNTNNRFWKILSEVFPKSTTKLNLKVSIKDKEDVKAKNKADRENFCREHKIAITDIIDSCIRMHNNSKDEQLLVHHYTDIIKILKEHKSIERIILTAKSFGSSVNHHFYQYVTMGEIDFEFNGTEGTIKIDGRKINILSVNSTSSRSSLGEKELIQLYKKAFSRND